MKSELTRMFLKRHIRLIIIVAILLASIVGGLTAMFPNMAMDDAGSAASSWPAIMRQIFGDPLAGFTNIYAWMELEVFHVTLWVVLGVLASIMAAHIIAQEAEQRTLDILLSTPHSRAAILAGRLVALVLLAASAAVPVVAACYLGALARGLSVDPVPIILSTASAVLMALNIGCITLLVSIWIPRQIPTIAIAMGAAGFLFLAEEMLVPAMPWLGHISPLNPFHYYNTADVLIRSSRSALPFVALLGIALVLVLVSIITFTLRDAS